MRLFGSWQAWMICGVVLVVAALAIPLAESIRTVIKLEKEIAVLTTTIQHDRQVCPELGDEVFRHAENLPATVKTE
jgi:hypothetical protein